MTRLPRSMALVLAITLIGAACSGSGADTTTTTPGGTSAPTAPGSGATAPPPTTSPAATTTLATTSTTGPGGTAAPGTTAAGASTTVTTATTTTTGSTATTRVESPYTTDGPTLVAQCQGGDDIACDILFLISAPDSEYEAIGQDCGGRGSDAGFCSGYSFDSEADDYGDDPFLDVLYDMCRSGGANVACGLLCDITPLGSGYEELGCSKAPVDYGDDAFLDGLWDACAAGDYAACDELYFVSPVDSEYEAFGESCGNRNEPAESCVELYG